MIINVQILIAAEKTVNADYALFAAFANDISSRTDIDRTIFFARILSTGNKPKWRNRQTRYVQGVVPSQECGFDSHLRHTGSGFREFAGPLFCFPLSG
jgi:hypothetical protein